MHFSDNGFVVVGVIIRFVLIYCENKNASDDIESQNEEDLATEDLYSFVALVDIVFTDGSKRTCTGTIIHDYVVITAAHCVKLDDAYFIQAEITASFVVIGTKKMFDTGYEQYLPIERIIIHPNYRGWTADLALIHTFAGMMSDKPGRIVPLATEKTSSPVDSQVTVFSWGQYELNNMASIFGTKKTYEPVTEEDGRTHRDAMYKMTAYLPFDVVIEDSTEPYPDQRSRQRHRRRRTKMRKGPKTLNDEIQEKYISRESSTERRSSNVERFYTNLTTESTKYSKKSFQRPESFYRNNWRRTMGVQQNKLTIEVFGFVNMQMCKKLVEKGMPSSYEIRNPNEVLCYASDKNFITEEDSGAPAMRRGRLVAVTVGGVDFEGERVAVGMKMTCFCSWIADNIPKTGTKLRCCKNCCETKGETEHNNLYFRHARTRENINV